MIDLKILKDKARTPVIFDALEKFLPEWIESLVPHYQEAKRQNVELLSLNNHMFLGSPVILYESNGIDYCLFENLVFGGMELAFNGAHHYQNCEWYECFVEKHPDLDNDARMRIDSLLNYMPYMSRLSNTKAPYDVIAKQADEYFKQITSDPTAGLSLGHDSFVYFTPKAKDYINSHHYLD